MRALTLPFRRTQNRDFTRSSDFSPKGAKPTQWARFHSLVPVLCRISCCPQRSWDCLISCTHCYTSRSPSASPSPCNAWKGQAMDSKASRSTNRKCSAGCVQSSYLGLFRHLTIRNSRYRGALSRFHFDLSPTAVFPELCQLFPCYNECATGGYEDETKQHNS